MLIKVSLSPKEIKKFFEIYAYKSDLVDPKIDEVCKSLAALDGTDANMTKVENNLGAILRGQFNRAALLVGETDHKHQVMVQVHEHHDFCALGIRIIEEDYQIRICENTRAKTFKEI